MAHVGEETGRFHYTSALAVWWATTLGFLGLFGIVVLSRAAGGPEGLFSWRKAALFLAFSGILMAVHHLYRPTTSSGRDPKLFSLQLSLLVVLLALLYQSRTPGFGLGINRDLELVAVFLVLVGFCVLAADPREYTPGQWLVIGCFATVVGILFYHSAEVAEISVRSRHPLWWGSLVGVNLLVLPRYLSREQFLWSLNRIAAAIVLLALPIYVYGEYALFGLEFAFHGTHTVPLVGAEFRATRALFVNRNTLGAVLFAGIVAGVAELHRSLEADHYPASAPVPAALLAVNLLGFVLAYDLKLWLLAPGMLGIYAAYLAFGRRILPVAMVGGVLYVVAGLLTIYYGIVSIDDSNRFLLWDAGVRAIRHRPLLLGEGLIAPGAWLEPFHPLGAVSPHNSYISIWLRTGIVGGLAYIGLVAGGLVKGTVEYETVDVALLVLAFGFAVHQLFEAYTLFQTGTSSVLATLAIGYLVFGLPMERNGEDDTPELEADDEAIPMPPG